MDTHDGRRGVPVQINAGRLLRPPERRLAHAAALAGMAGCPRHPRPLRRRRPPRQGHLGPRPPGDGSKLHLWRFQFCNSVTKAEEGLRGRYQNSRAEGGSLSADQKREGEEGRDCNMRRVFVLGMALGLAMATLASCSRGRDVSGLPVGDLDTIFSHGALNEFNLQVTPSDLDWLNHHELLEEYVPGTGVR